MASEVDKKQPGNSDLEDDHDSMSEHDDELLGADSEKSKSRPTPLTADDLGQILDRMSMHMNETVLKAVQHSSDNMARFVTDALQAQSDSNQAHTAAAARAAVNAANLARRTQNEDGTPAAAAALLPTSDIRRRESSPPHLTEVDPIQYTSFKKCFKRVVRLNEWDDITSVLKLATCIRDNAGRTIDHLEFSDFNNLEQAFAAIDKVYLNPAGIEFYKATFKQAVRNPQETLIQWHTRCRELYLRAYPEDDEFDQEPDLKDKFVLQIRDRTLSTQLKASDGYENWTFTDVLTRAQRIHGSALIVHHAYGGRAVNQESIQSLDQIINTPQDNPPSLQAIPTQKPGLNRKQLKCYHCGKDGHVVNECSLNQKTIDRIRADPGKYNMQLIPGGPSNSRGRWNPRGFSRGSGFRGKPFNRGRPYTRYQRGGRGRKNNSYKRPQIQMIRDCDPYAAQEEDEEDHTTTEHDDEDLGN